MKIKIIKIAGIIIGASLLLVMSLFGIYYFNIINNMRLDNANSVKIYYKMDGGPASYISFNINDKKIIDELVSITKENHIKKFGETTEGLTIDPVWNVEFLCDDKNISYIPRGDNRYHVDSFCRTFNIPYMVVENQKLDEYVIQLINERLSTGTYEIEWLSSNAKDKYNDTKEMTSIQETGDINECVKNISIAFDVETTCEIEIINDISALQYNDRFIMNPIQITDNDRYNCANIVFELDKENLDCNIRDIKVVWYGEDNATYETLNDVVYDEENATISFKTWHLGRYALVE